MTQLAICTDLDRCVGCLACSVSCKVVNGVPIGNFWNKTLRVGPTPKEGGSGQFGGADKKLDTPVSGLESACTRWRPGSSPWRPSRRGSA